MASDIRRVVFVFYGQDAMQRRWTIGYLSEAMKGLGVSVQVVDFAQAGVERACETADVAVVFKCFVPAMTQMMCRLKRKGVFVAFMVDDYLFQPGCKYTNGGLTTEPLRVADAVVSPSSLLLSKVPFDKPKILRRNVLDAEGMAALRQEYRRGGEFSMGLTMMPSRGKYMEPFMDRILAEASAGMTDGERLVCHSFGGKALGKHDRVEVRDHGAFERSDWKGFYSKLVELDMGVTVNPLDDEDVYWSCKSELKFVESGAMGVPLVTSRVPPYTGLISEGANGFMASTPKEFADKVLLLMRDEELSRKVGREARRQVERDYDCKKNAEGFVRDLTEARIAVRGRAAPVVGIQQGGKKESVMERPEIDLPGNGVCMVMGYTKQNPKFMEMGEFAAKVNMEYCRRHGYGFRLYTSGFAADRHPSWSKLLFVKDALRHYEWVMWMDTDAVVTNPEMRLERFLDNRYMLVVGKQNWNRVPWNTVNFGVFFMRNDPAVGEFVERVWADLARRGRIGWEQDGVRKVMETPAFKNKVKVVCRKEFNSLVPHESLGLGADFSHLTESWSKGDLVAHFGGKRDDVVEAMRGMLGGESQRAGDGAVAGARQEPKPEPVEIRRMAFVCRGHNLYSARWTLSHLGEAVARAGKEVALVDLGRGGSYGDVGNADAVMLCRCVDAKTLETARELRGRGVFVLYGTDDYVVPPGCRHGGLANDERVAAALEKEADCLVSFGCGAPFVFGKPRILRKVAMGPEVMEFAKQGYRRTKGVFSVGMTLPIDRSVNAGKVTELFLREVDEMLRPGERMVFHCFGASGFAGMSKVKVVVHERVAADCWRTWMSQMKELDLGVVVEHADGGESWSCFDSEIRFAETGAMGVPVVASRFRPYLGLVTDGANGFFASTAREFARKVLELMRNEELSRRMSEAMRTRVEKEFCADAVAVTFLEDLRQVMTRERMKANERRERV